MVPQNGAHQGRSRTWSPRPPLERAPDERPRSRVRTFHPRRGRLSGRHFDALERLWPRYGVPITDGPVTDGWGADRPVTDGPGADGRGTDGRGADGPGTIAAPLDPVKIFGRVAPLVLEIGPGMGDATAAMAEADPGRDYLAVEVHTPGVANLLALIAERGLANLRIGHGDALDLLRYQLAPDSLDAIHVFFPDPWPKARHHKRRLIRPDNVTLLCSRLRPGGTLHCATDWADYAESMLETLSAEADLVNAAANGFSSRPGHRPPTKFERRGTEAGRRVYDLVFRRRAVGPPAGESQVVGPPVGEAPPQVGSASAGRW